MLKITRREGSPYWQITGTYCGVRVRESTQTADRETAEKLRTQREREIEQGHIGRRSFADAIEAYLDNGGEDRYLEKINEVMGMEPLDAVNQEMIDKKAREAYGEYTKTEGGKVYKHKPSTIKRQFYDPVASVLHYAADIDWIPYRRIKKPKVKTAAPVWAEPDYFAKFWTACDKEMKALTMFLCFAGCRIQECLDLEWKHIDLDGERAFIPKTKTDAYRTVHLPAPLIVALEAIKGDGKVWNYTYHHVRWRLKKFSKEAGVPYMSTHKIGSHTFATWMRRYAGVDARGLLDTGRWSSLQMAEKYTHTDVSEAGKKTEAFAALFDTKSDTKKRKTPKTRAKQ